MVVDIRMTGDKELDRQLRRLAGNDQKKIVRKALRAGARPIQADAIANAPEDEEGRLKKVKVRSAKRSRRSIGARVGFFSGSGEDGIAAHVELGTRRSRAKPFLRPALAKNKDRSIRIIGRSTWQGIRLLAAGSKR